MAKDTDGIAVVGMAGRFPEAADLDAFWDNLRAGRECVHFYSDAELAALGWNAAELKAHGHVAATPRIANPESFDAAFFGYTVDQAAMIDPQQRLFLEVCWEAFENSGRNPRGDNGRVGVFAGQGVGNYLLFNLAAAGKLHAAEYFSTVVSNGPDFLCSRVAFTCGLTGPCVTVQTACSTGIVALHQACQSLLNFECDVALTGAVSLQLLPVPGHFYDGGKSIYSADGHSRIFDAHATGTIFGDGCGVVVLRRLEDALADGDPIRAVIRGTAINNSGTVAAGFSTPSARAQEDAAAEALAIAGVKADSISYVELHGSGSTIGDAIEVTALTRVFRKASSATGACGIGAVKSNVGHLGAAAGMASLCKTILALEHGEIPPTILVDEVNPGLDLNRSPFHLVLKPEAFAQKPHRASVNSYGIGGSNGHVVLEEAPVPAAGVTPGGPHILLLSAATSTAIDALTARLAHHLQAHPELSLADVAWTLAMGRTELKYRRFVICDNTDDAIAQLLSPARDRDSASFDARDVTGEQTASLAELGERWISGVTINWSAVMGGDRRRVALPSYPFERKRCWIDLPVNQNGAQSSQAAPVARSAAVVAARPSAVQPSSALEVTLCTLWRKATGMPDAGIDDNFFAIGGTSLQLAEVHAELRSTVLADLTIVDVFTNPTVRALAVQIERVKADPSLAGQLAPEIGGLTPGIAGQLSAREIDVLRKDTALAADIRPASPASGAAAFEHVLLTGATGFLGVFLLKELLARTRATVYCHVRAADATAGFARIKKAMMARDLWLDADADRIVPVCGDLGDARLGLNAADYATLCERIDAIVHNGATVNFTPPYASLKKVNVTGTEDVLRFACTGRTKTLHFVSSTGVWGNRFPVDEDDPLDDIGGLENGYTQSKWVAERLVQEAGRRGLPVTIHRPPRVVGDTRTGSANLEDFVARVIKGCAELGAAPSGHFFDIMSPVDFVARAIVAIALSPESLRLQRFHIVHPKLMTWRTVLDFMPSVGLPLDVVPYPEWRARLIAFCQQHENALKTLLPMFRPADAGGFAEISADIDMSLLPDVPCGNATTILSSAGIQCPQMDAALLTTYFNYFFETGFITRR